MDFYDLFWSDVKEILGEDFYATIPRVTASEIRFKLEQIVAENLCENCKRNIRYEFRKWLLEQKAAKEEFRKAQEKRQRQVKQ
ncbi:MAG: hypothetical protein QXH20_04285 [Candidatus Bathyarchaeia archaeon]